jgi:hypothetical protein
MSIPASVATRVLDDLRNKAKLGRNRAA